MPPLRFAHQIGCDSSDDGKAGFGRARTDNQIGHTAAVTQVGCATPPKRERMFRVLVIHGPNLNLLGEREPEIYGKDTLADIDAAIAELARELGVEVRTVQHNSEGSIVDVLHEARKDCDAVLLNPGAYTHYSYAIADAIAAIPIPVIEVHLSNVHAREQFRRTSVVAPVCAGTIGGLGRNSYLLALRAVAGRAR